MADELSQIAHLFLSANDSPRQGMTVRVLSLEYLPNPPEIAGKIASHLAHQLDSVALLETQSTQAHLQLFTTAKCATKKRQTKTDLIPALADLPELTDLLLIATSNNTLLNKCSEISVVATPDSKMLVAAYSRLKVLAQTRPDALGLTVVNCSSVSQGRELAHRLSQAAKEFLGLILRLDAIIPVSSRLSRKTLARTDSLQLKSLARTISSL